MKKIADYPIIELPKELFKFTALEQIAYIAFSLYLNNFEVSKPMYRRSKN